MLIKEVVPGGVAMNIIESGGFKISYSATPNRLNPPQLAAPPSKPLFNNLHVSLVHHAQGGK